MLRLTIGLFAQPFTTLPLPPHGTFARKTAVVTGANTGIGLETSRHLLALGAPRVIIGVRNATKGEAAKVSLLKTPGISADAQVEVWDLDQSSFASVKAFCARAAALEKIDYLFLNAGVMSTHFNTTADGWEEILQVNDLSTTLLGLLLLPKLILQSRAASAAAGNSLADAGLPRMIITTSGMHVVAPFLERSAPNCLAVLNERSNFEKNRFDRTIQYQNSKLLNVYITRALARLVPHTDGKPLVIVATVDPGLCKSTLGRADTPIPTRILNRLTGYTNEYGSRNLLIAAAGGIEGQGGYYTSMGKLGS